MFLLRKGYKRETRFTSKFPANEIIKKIEQAAGPLGFDVQKKNYKVLMLSFRQESRPATFFIRTFSC